MVKHKVTKYTQGLQLLFNCL